MTDNDRPDDEKMPKEGGVTEGEDFEAEPDDEPEDDEDD